MQNLSHTGQGVITAPRRVQELEQALAEAHGRIAAMEKQHRLSGSALRSSNAEGHAANRELRTLNDGLESSNLDLTALNEEMALRNAELRRLNDHLRNLESTVHTAIVLLDRDLSVRRFTPLAEKAFNLLAHDIGRSLGTVKFDFDFPELISWVREVIETKTPKEQEVQDHEGRWYSLRARPYVTSDDEVDGAVLMLMDIDALQKSRRELKATHDYADAIVEQVSPLLVLDKDLRVIQVNRSFLQHFQVSSEQMQNCLVYEWGGGQWDIAALREALEKDLPENGNLEDFEVEHDFPILGRRTLLLSASQLEQSQNILLSIEDVTERRQAERIIAEEQRSLQAQVKERTTEIVGHVEQLRRISFDLAEAEQRERRRLSAVLHDDLQQILVGTRMHAMTAFGSSGSAEKAAFVQELLTQAIDVTRSLAKEVAPPVLYEEGLGAGLQWLSRWAEKHYGLKMEVATDDDAVPENVHVCVFLFEAVRELLLNIAKHADTTGVRVSLKRSGDVLRLRVEDSGKGFDVQAAKLTRDETGTGIVSMHERLILMGGRMEIETSPGRGTRIEIVVPMAISLSLPENLTLDLVEVQTDGKM